MYNIDSERLEKIIEHIPMTTYTTKNERSSNPVVPLLPITTKPGKPKGKTKRSLSLQISNIDIKQNILTSTIQDYPEIYVPRLTHITLKRGTKSKENQKRLNAAFIEAVKCREVAEIERLIEDGANPNATCPMDNISACHLAAKRPDGALDMLLRYEVQPLRFDSNGRTPLHIAAWEGNLRQVALLLELPRDLTSRVAASAMASELEDEVKTQTHSLKELVNVKCVMHFNKETPELPEEWIASGIEHNCKELEKGLPLLQAGWTPLHAASARAKSYCAKLLIAAGADPTIRDLVGRTPLDIVGSTFYTTDGCIDPQRFTETVSMLAVDKKNFTLRNRKIRDSPLHTAVELNCLEAATALMNIGVPIDWLNRAGLSPLHIAISKEQTRMLQVLLKDRSETEDEHYRQIAADVRDKNGNTILHAAVLENWESGVILALEAGVNIIAKNNKGDTALHQAADEGNIDILNRIIDAAKPESIVKETNSKDETPLMKAVAKGYTECVRILLDEKSSIKQTIKCQINVFHVAAEKGYTDVLQLLVDYDYSLTRAMINYLTTDMDGFAPLHYAVQNNHLQCVKLLLSKNAFISLKTTIVGVHIGSTPLHIAAKHNNVKIANILISNSLDTVDRVNGEDWTPLHTACHYGSRDMIMLLLEKGADLSHSGSNSKQKISTPMQLIMNNLSKPTEFLNHIFNSCISTNGKYIQDPNCEVTVDYKILVPKAEGRQQMRVFRALLNTGDRYEQSHLLVHPLLQSFLHLKWRALLPFFYTMILLYGFFVSYLTMYVYIMFHYKDTGQSLPVEINSTAMSVFLYGLSFLVVILEALFVNINQRYFYQLETWVKFIPVVLSMSLPNTFSATIGTTLDIPRYIATVCLLLSWLEMMFLLSRFPSWGYYVLMFGKVCHNVIKILLTFSFLLVGFALSFMVLVRHKDEFENPWTALVKTLVMLTTEYEYVNFMGLVDKDDTNSAFLLRLAFVLFLVLGGIVLMNLMVGVAVNDLNNLELIGNIRRLTKQVEFQLSLDRLLYNRYIRKILPQNLTSILISKKTIDSSIVLLPRRPNESFYKSLPTHLRNNIFEIAQSRIKQTDEDVGSENYKNKLDEIFDMMKKNQENAIAIPSFKTIARKEQNVNVDSGIIEGNKNNSDCLNEIRQTVNVLEMKVDAIINRLQGGQDHRVTTSSYIKSLKNGNF